MRDGSVVSSNAQLLQGGIDDPALLGENARTRSR